MLLSTNDNGQSFTIMFLSYYGDIAENCNEVSLSDLSQDIKNVTITLSDKTDFDVSWM